MAGIVTQLAGLMPLVLFFFKKKKDDGPKGYEIRETRLWLNSMLEIFPCGGCQNVGRER